MDSICDMPSSAETSAGLRIGQVRRMLQAVTCRFRPVYLHLAEAAPPENEDGRIRTGKALGAVSTFAFWFKDKEDSSFQPQEYCRISRTGNEDPTPRWGQKTF